MNDQVNTAPGQKQAPHEAEPTIPIAVDEPPSPPTANPEHCDKPQTISASDWIMVAATIVIAAGTLVSAGAIVLQWREMVGGGAQTGQLVDAANKQVLAAGEIAEASKRNAAAAEKFADSANDIKSSMGDAVDRLGKQAAATELARQTSQDDSSKSLRATIENFHQEQRAWLGMGQAKIVSFDSINPLKMLLPLTNTGKTPAIHVKVALKSIYPIDPEFAPQFSEDFRFHEIQDVAPEAPYEFPLTEPGAARYHDQIIAGRISAVYYGVITYSDIYTPLQTHTTHFCLAYDPSFERMNLCSIGNTMD